MNKRIILPHNIDGSVLEHLWNAPECVQEARIENNQVFLFCNPNNPIFAGYIEYPDTAIKGVKFDKHNLQLTL
jgi:hypothetical protein